MHWNPGKTDSEVENCTAYSKTCFTAVCLELRSYALVLYLQIWIV